jgi:hypothetical protein
MAITITTTSSPGYMQDKENALYPAFVDNMVYNSASTTAIYNYFQLEATGGTTYTWQLESGSLPTGLSLSSDGKISGTPIEEGNFTFVVRASSGDQTVTKSLQLVAHPYRGKWMSESKFGLIVHWGRFSYPTLSAVDSGPAFVARATNFNAVQWANQLDAMGAEYLEFSANHQDSFRNWPSLRPTRREMKSSRDFVGEIINACHAKGIKVGTYWAVDYNGGLRLPYEEGTNISQRLDYDAADTTWGTMNKYLIMEYIMKGGDYIWIDVGAASELNPAIPYRNLQWDDVMPLWRYHNPFFCIGVNPGTRKEGLVQREFYTDFNIGEPPASAETEGTTLITANPNAPTGKKMGLQVTNLLSSDWVTRENFETQGPVKNPDAIIENMKKNWDNDASLALAIPVPADGTLIHPRYQAAMTKITAFTAANKGRAATPVIKKVGNKVQITAQSKGRIYYTTDGSMPTTKSLVYTKPLPLTKNMIVRARVKEVGKFISLAEWYNDQPAETKGGKVLLTQYEGNVPNTDTNSYYRGMLFVVGSAPIIINKIGRKSNGGTSVDRRVIIRRQSDKYAIWGGVMKYSEVEEKNGFFFMNTSPIRLEAGKVYYIGIQEPASESYYSNHFNIIPKTDDLRILSPVVLTKYGDLSDTIAQTPGQFVNFEYTVVETERKSNLLLGKNAFFRSLTGAPLQPSAGTGYASNGIDGDPNSLAIAGGQFAYVYYGDMMETQKVSRIELEFGERNYATEFQVYTSIDIANQTLVATLTKNKLTKFVFNFDPIDARYIHVRATKPSAANQEGSQMAIVDLKAF